jgi:hypothetical protein
MSNDRPQRRTTFRDLNWFGKSVYLGGTVLRLTANLVDATADRVSSIAAESKRAFNRELDPNIEEARVVEEYPRSTEDDSATSTQA